MGLLGMAPWQVQQSHLAPASWVGCNLFWVFSSMIHLHKFLLVDLVAWKDSSAAACTAETCLFLAVAANAVVVTAVAATAVAVVASFAPATLAVAFQILLLGLPFQPFSFPVSFPQSLALAFAAFPLDASGAVPVLQCIVLAEAGFPLQQAAAAG